MSVIQSTQQELRYFKRSNLINEARVIGEMNRDCIRAIGLDCIYYKKNTDTFTEYKGIVDSNTILKRAYGYDITPDYSMSAHVIMYPVVQADVFQLQKLGMIPQEQVELYVGSTDFACALAPQVGRLKEYQIDEIEVECEVPLLQKHAKKYPYELKLKKSQSMYTCGILAGKYQAIIPPYEEGKENTIVCDPYEHTDFQIEFPSNEDLYKSLTYKIANDDYLETMLQLTYTVHEEVVNGRKRAFLLGKLHGSVLFFDIDQLSKYTDKIYPMVGDIVEIDFPTTEDREKFQITECFDKQLTPESLSPLLHKFVWKCKAVRYTDSYEEGTPHEAEADKRIEEFRNYDDVVQEEVAKKVSMYDKLGNSEKTEDDVYGGYNGVVKGYDKNVPDLVTHDKFDFIDDGSAITLMQFGAGSKLVTTGYELLFIDDEDNAYQIACNDKTPVPSKMLVAEQHLKWLKATDSSLVFVNIEGVVTSIAVDFAARQNDIEICLEDLNVKTLDDAADINIESENFYKFKNTRTWILGTGKHLYCKLASNKQLYTLI